MNTEKNKYRRIRSINVPHYAEYVFPMGEGLGVKYHKDQEMKIEEYLERIDPVFGIEGWYSDRLTKTSWVETNGVAFTTDYIQWRTDFRNLSFPWISSKDRAALQQLHRSGLITKEQQFILDFDSRRQNARVERFQIKKRIRSFLERVKLKNSAVESCAAILE